MKSKPITFLASLVFFSVVNAQSDVLFSNGFEFLASLNDTGITWDADNTSGNNSTCSSNLSSPQDCNYGRDDNHNDDSDGHAGFSFTKLDATGTPLPDQTVDYATTVWACVKDNITGLVWEVKTTAAGIHNQDNTYLWGGLTAIGRDHPNRQGTYYDPSWNDLVQGSNTENLCGFDNWRLPTVAELSSIVNKGTSDPMIDTNYFPNTSPTRFWTSGPVANSPSKAWCLYLRNGYDGGLSRDNDFRVRLVRSE